MSKTLINYWKKKKKKHKKDKKDKKIKNKKKKGNNETISENNSNKTTDL